MKTSDLYGGSYQDSEEDLEECSSQSGLFDPEKLQEILDEFLTIKKFEEIQAERKISEQDILK